MKIIIRILVNALALFITAYLLPGIELAGGLWGLLVVAIIFGLVNALIRPIVLLFSLPITLVTLGLFTLIINAAMLLLTGLLAGSYLSFSGGIFQNFTTACFGGIIISLVSIVMSWILPDKDKK
jgi:putative membrane protein